MNEVDHEKNGKRYRDPEWPLDDPVPMASKKMEMFCVKQCVLVRVCVCEHFIVEIKTLILSESNIRCLHLGH